MKKVLCSLLILIICLSTYTVHAISFSKFEATFETDDEVKNNQPVLYFGWRGEEAMKIDMSFEIDTSMLEVLSISPGDTFKVDYNVEHLSNHKDKYNLTFVSDTPLREVIYAGVVTKIKDKYKVGKSTEIKAYDIIAENADGKKYRSLGYYIKLKRETKYHMLAIRSENNDQTKRERLINTLLPFIITFIVLCFAVIIVILLLPKKGIEDRRSKINAQLDPENYPIPGVGPLPKIKKKEKVDIIEPEEKVIQPLKEFLSKSTDVNEELKNKELEVDKDMFKNNPTKEGEDNLININPLAFDDGEELSDVIDNQKESDDDDIDTL